MILTDVLSAVFHRLLEALDYEPPSCRVYLARPSAQDYPWNVDCTACELSPVASIGITSSTVTMASTAGLAGEKARAHLAEHHGWRP